MTNELAILARHWLAFALVLAVQLLLIIALRRPVRARLGAVACYRLWLLPLLWVPCYLLGPPLLAALASLRAAAPTASDPSALQRLIQIEALPFTVDLGPAQGFAAGGSLAFHGWTLFACVWAGGTLALIAWQGCRWLRFSRHVRSSSTPLSAAEHNSIGTAQHFDAGVPVVKFPGIHSAALYGVFKPVLLLPDGFSERYDSNQRHIVLAHEAVHLRRGDNAWNLCALLLLALFWTNPLMFIAWRYFRLDQELSCDALALARCNKEQQGRYARTLLDSLTSQATMASQPALSAWDNLRDIKERSLMIRQHLKLATRPGTTLLSLLGLTIVGASMTLTLAGIVSPRAEAAEPPQEARDLEAQARRVEQQSLAVEAQGREVAQQAAEVEKQSRQLAQQARQVEEQSPLVAQQAQQTERQTRQVEQQAQQAEQQARQVEQQAQQAEQQARQVEQQAQRTEQLAQQVAQLDQQVEQHSRQVEQQAAQAGQQAAQAEQQARQVEQQARQTEQQARQVEQQARQAEQQARQVQQQEAEQPRAQHSARQGPRAHLGVVRENEDGDGRNIDQQTGRILSAAIKYLNEDNFAEARARLEKLQPSRLSPFERSRYEQLLFNLDMNAEDYPGARSHLQAALDSGGLNEQESAQMRYQLAQLYVQEENYPAAAEALERWIASQESPNSAAYYLLAASYYYMEDFTAALPNAQQAVELAGDMPQEPWLQILNAVYMQLGQYDAAEPVAARLVEMFPEKTAYRRQLEELQARRAQDPAQ